MREPDRPDVPSEEEVRYQLRLMTARPPFDTSEQLVNLLTILVEEKLKGNILTAKELETRLSGKRGNPSGDNARIGVLRLRKALDQYYRKTSIDIYDWVRISLPKPASQFRPSALKKPRYPVEFSHHPFQRHFRQLTWARMLINTLRPNALHQALTQIEATLDVIPDLLHAQIMRVECLCLMAIIAPDARPKRELTAIALESALAIANENREQRGAIRALAIALLCNHDIAHASSAFVRIAQLKPGSALESLWFTALDLFVLGPEKAQATAAIITTYRATEFLPWLAYAFYSYTFRSFDGAESMLFILEQIEPHSWVLQLGYALVHTARNDPKAASFAYHQMTTILNESKLMMPGLAILIGKRLLQIETKPAVSDIVRNEMALLLEPPIERREWFQIAISIMDDDPEGAISALGMAWKDADPLVFGIKFWPLFDPLRGYPGFQELVEAISTALTGVP